MVSPRCDSQPAGSISGRGHGWCRLQYAASMRSDVIEIDGRSARRHLARRHVSTSARQHVSTSAPRHVSTSARQHLGTSAPPHVGTSARRHVGRPQADARVGAAWPQPPGRCLLADPRATDRLPATARELDRIWHVPQHLRQPRADARPGGGRPAGCRTPRPVRRSPPSADPRRRQHRSPGRASERRPGSLPGARPVRLAWHDYPGNVPPAVSPGAARRGTAIPCR
jgi:hypothetical protein